MKKYNPTSPGRRQMIGYDFSNLSKKKSLKSLTSGFKKDFGRNDTGTITMRHRGSGVKRLFRFVDFKQNKIDIPAKVEHIEYDPNRTARIALLIFADGERRYVLAPEKLKAGDKVQTYSEKGPLEIGSRMKLKHIPQGTIVHNIELVPGNGGQIARSAGMGIQVLATEKGYTQLKMSSGEVRMVSENCLASIGQVSNAEHSNIVIGKAGRSRWMGRRPEVRGSAMNPVDHPHGGGEGRQSIGLRHPKTPWGKPALGVKTRRTKRSNKFIVRRRVK